MANNFAPARTYRSNLLSSAGTKRLQWASAMQREAFQYGPAPLLLSGGFGAGKTLIATRKILFINDLFPGNRGIIARRVGDELRKTTMPTFFKDCPPEAYMRGGRRADQEKILRLNPRYCEDGVLRSSEILFLHLDDPEIQHILRGLEINWFLLDQAEEMEEEMFDVLLKRLGRWDQAWVPPSLIEAEERAGRPWAWWNTPDGKYRPGALAIPPTYAMATANPDLETHWLWRRFHEDSDEYQEKWKSRGYKMFTLNPLENRFLPLQNRLELLQADPEWQARFVYGKWGAGSGNIHKVPPESIIEGTPEILEWIRHSCTLHRSMDHGDSSPTCCLWWGVDDSGNCYCVTPETKVLTEDLRWVQAGGVEAGDTLAGFDEYPCPTGRRRWRRSVVEATERIIQPCYRVTLDDGTVVTSSSKHRWLTKDGVWRFTDKLAVGHRIVKAATVWKTERSYEAGYLAAAFDGEGHCTHNQHNTPILGFTQKKNVMFRIVKRALESRGFRIGCYEYRPTMRQLILTRKHDIMRFLGSIRPKRLLPKFDVEEFGGFRGIAFPAVVKIEFVGKKEVVSMKTSTRTFIAEGLASHNCFREYYAPNKLISEHREAINSLSIDERYIFNLADPSIFNPTMQKKDRRFSVSDEYSDSSGLVGTSPLFWTKGDNDEMGTRNRINEYLRVDPDRIHPFTKERGSPRLFFIKRNEEYPWGCQHAIRELRSQRREKVGSDNGRDLYSDDRDGGVPDHSYDCLSLYQSITYSQDSIEWLSGPISKAPASGWVLTPMGPKKYTDLKCYRRNVPMVKVTTEDRRSMIVTPDHLLLTNRGWRRAEDATGLRCLSLSSSRTGFSSFVADSIVVMANTGFVDRAHSIVKSLRRTSARFRQGFSSITRIMIRAITGLGIWSPRQELLTPATTIGDYSSLQLFLLCGEGSSAGSGQRKPECGEPSSTGPTSVEGSTREPKKLAVSTVGWFSSLLLRLSLALNDVMDAKLRHGSSEIVSVEPTPNEDAWCLTVEHPLSAFCVEGGLVVHNCVRYFIASRPPLSQITPKKRLTGTMLEARMMLKRQLRNDPRWQQHIRDQRVRMRGY